MPGINYREMQKMKGAMTSREFIAEVCSAFDPKVEGHLEPADLSLFETACVCFGERRVLEARRDPQVLLTEAGDGVDSTAFAEITGRVVTTRMIDEYELAIGPANELVTTEPNITNDLERKPGFAGLGDVAEPIQEGLPYPRVGFGEDYQDMPRGHKYGLIVPITREAVFFDRTGQVLERAGKVGEVLGYRKAREIYQMVLGITSNYNWQGTAYDTYYPGAAGNPWTNIHSQNLVDWTNIDIAEQLFQGMTDPNTSQPISIGGRQIGVMPAAYANALRILNAMDVRHTTAGGVVTVSPNPKSARSYTLIDMGVLCRAEAAATHDFGTPNELWWLGDFKKAFSYRENWPIQTLRAPPNAQDEWDRDIVAQFKGTERGVAAVSNPRYMLISSGTCGHSSSGETLCTPDTWPAIDSAGGTATR